MAKRFGIIPHLFAQPLFYGLVVREGPASELFELERDSSAQLAIRLRQKELDGAFLSPIDYAKEYQMYRIVPEVCVTSRGESNAILVLFNESIRRINTVAVDPNFGSEIVLAHLVMAEKYDSTPKFIPMIGSLDQALQKADAVLLVGDAALAMKDTASKLDLVDEWDDMTGLSYVHGVWVCREGALTPEELKVLIEASRIGATTPEQVMPDVDPVYLGKFRYDLSEDAVGALTEFFRMAYYHGILKDIPDVRLHPLEEHRPSPPISLN